MLRYAVRTYIVQNSVEGEVIGDEQLVFMAAGAPTSRLIEGKFFQRNRDTSTGGRPLPIPRGKPSGSFVRLIACRHPHRIESLFSIYRGLLMPKKNAKSSLPLDLRNRLASSPRPFGITSDARRNLSERQLSILAKYTCALASMGKPILPSLSAKRLSDFRLDDRELKEIPFSKELTWVAALLEHHADLLNDLLTIKLRVENLTLSGQFENALSALDQLEGEGGFSLCSIEMRQSILQLSGGLSRQKDYLKSIRVARKAGDSVAYIAFHGSIRNETTTQIFSRSLFRKVRVGVLPLIISHMVAVSHL